MSKGWHNTTIGEQVLLQRGFDITKKEQRPGPYPVVSSSGISSYHAEHMANGPGVILGRKGVVGSVYFIDCDYWPHDTSLWVKDFRGNDRRFVYYFFRNMAADLASLDVGSANPSLNRNHVHPIKTVWPPLPEQRAIAATLAALDDKIELNRKMNATLEAMARALFRDWFVDFGPTRAKMEGRPPYLSPDLWPLFPDRLDDEGKPEGWAMRTLDSLFEVSIGRTPPRKESEHFLPADVGIPWLSIKSMGDVQSFAFDTEETLAPSSVKKFKVKVVPAGTVLVSFKLTVGRVAIAAQDMATNEAIAHLVRHQKTPVSDAFTYFAMKEFDYATLGSTSSIATAVNSASIKSISLLVPSPQVQEAFTATAQVLLDRIRTNVLESRTLAQTLDLLLPRLMSGELRVAEGERIAANTV